MAGKTNRVTPAQLETFGHQLVQLISHGATMAKAAEALKLDNEVALRAWKRTLAQMADDATKQEMLTQELNTLLIMQRGLMPAAKEGDPAAVRAMIQVMSKRAEYLGLNEAVRVKIEHSSIQEAVRDVVQIIEGETAEVTPLRRIEPKTA